jgi:hypothetical protein
MKHGQTHGGKGSSQRPTDGKKFASNWDAIFNKTQQKPKDKEKEVKK